MDFLSQFALSHPWVPMALTIYLVVVNALKGVRDAIDKTPLTDDSPFERLVTILSKTLGYLAGFRPTAPEGTKPVAGESADAVGVKVEEKK